jgi:hypothetical protein
MNTNDEHERRVTIVARAQRASECGGLTPL